MNPARLSLYILVPLYTFFAVFSLVLSFVYGAPPALGLVVGLSSALCICLMLAIDWGLSHGKYWAWVSGLIWFSLCTVSILFPFGVMGLYGLLKSDVREFFTSL